MLTPTIQTAIVLRGCYSYFLAEHDVVVPKYQYVEIETYCYVQSRQRIKLTIGTVQRAMQAPTT
jgi:hypothetical protein